MQMPTSESIPNQRTRFSTSSTIDSNTSYGSVTDYPTNESGSHNVSFSDSTLSVPASASSTSSSGYIGSQDNRSNATTPNMSNLSNNPNKRALDVRNDEYTPSRFMKTSFRNNGSSRSENDIKTLPTNTDVPFSSESSRKNGPSQANSVSNGRSRHHPIDSFPLSRIATSSTVVLLILGLILCICTLLQYFVLGSPSSLPFGQNGNNSSGNGDNIHDDRFFFNDGKKGSSKRKRPNDVSSLLDGLGRYVIKDYDALPTFSDFLPVSQYLNHDRM